MSVYHFDIMILDTACILRDTDYVFFFSSRRRHTRLQGDWSSDVCSSDLVSKSMAISLAPLKSGKSTGGIQSVSALNMGNCNRSEERRVGKECRSRRSPYH